MVGLFFSFMEKLKGLKVLLKGWNKETFRKIFSQKQVLIDTINSLDSLEESGCFNEESVVEREVCRSLICSLVSIDGKALVTEKEIMDEILSSFPTCMAQGPLRHSFVMVSTGKPLACKILAYLRPSLLKKRLEKLSLRWVVLNPPALMP